MTQNPIQSCAWRLSLFWLVVLCLWVVPAHAQRVGTIREIDVRGNRAADRQLILNSIQLAPGDVATRASLARATRKLFALGLFDDIDIYGEEVAPGEVRLEIRLAEKRRLAKLVFQGNKKIDDQGLREKLTIGEGQIFDDRSLSEQVRAVEQAYKEKGYAQVQVAASVVNRETLGPGRVEVAFDIDEGRKVKIEAVRFRGAAGIDEELLRQDMKTKKKGFLFGGDYKEEELEADLLTVEQNMNNVGYKDAEVKGYTLNYADDKPALTVEIEVAPGPLYVMGPTSFNGNAVLTDDELTSALTFAAGEPYSAAKIQETVGNAYGLYAEQGYIYVAIDPVQETHDKVVQIDFQVAEGEPSTVRQVVVRGNTRTKEKVVRRHLYVRPGERFSRAALIRSQRDVFQLGYFQDVQVDFERASLATSDIDVIFEVEEKQIGTMQAGAAFSSDGGLSGFLEVGHPNLFGNGQQVNVKLENGSRRNIQEVSFTEPWFMDRPVSVGVDVFNTVRTQDLFDDTRRGGALRLGRRLPWPDYMSGFLTYRWERVTIDNVDPGIALNTAGFPRTTSSVALALTRNSTDNPFYPTTGSRVTWRSEFAGALFGGNVDFHKHLLDARTYVPTAWRPVLMLRARTGVLDGYGGAEGVPDYETFRLGGTTSNYLRGYGDYDVVPRGNDRFPGGRFMQTFTAELQFLVAEPLHGLVFFDAGDTWNSTDELRLTDLRKGAGIGMRIEIPLLGQLGFDYGYGFDRAGGGRWEPHFLLGNFF